MLRPCSMLLLAAAVGMSVSSVLAQPGSKTDQPPPKPVDKAPAKPDTAKPDAASAGDVDPAAKDFIDKFRAAVKDIKDLSCTVTQSQTRGDETMNQTGDLVAVFDRPAKGRAVMKQFKITSKHDDTDATWAFDGKTASRLDHKQKTYASMESPDGQAYPVMAAGMVVPTWAFGTDVLSNDGAKLVGAKMLPDVDLDGVKCRVVEYRVQIKSPAPMSEDNEKAEPLVMAMKQTRAVGPDLVARRIESSSTYTGGGEAIPTMSFKGTYTNVKVNTHPAQSEFLLAARDGYTTDKAPSADDLGIPSNEQPKLKFAAGDAAPDFSLKSGDGSTVTLASLKGKVVVLDFWATWCGPCKKAMPSVQKLHEKYKGKQVAVFGVDTWERAKTPEARDAMAKKYMDDHNYTYGLLYFGDDLAKKYGVSGIPTFVVIGPDGKVLHTSVGFDPEAEESLAAMIDKSLDGK